MNMRYEAGPQSNATSVLQEDEEAWDTGMSGRKPGKGWPPTDQEEALGGANL